MKRFTSCVFVLLFCAALAALVPVSAFAVDGVVLINQSTITSGLPGCKDPYLGDFPIVICSPGSYRLSGNLSVPAAQATRDAIDITSDNVSLDLNGFRILGTGTCSGTNGSCAVGDGIHSFNDGTTVQNGSIVGFTHGVWISAPSGGTGALVENIRVSNTYTGIWVETGGIVRLSSVAQCYTKGIYLEAGGILERNTAFQNGDTGLEIWYGSAIGNVAAGNAGTGLIVRSSTYGSNSLQFNVLDVFADLGATSQGNNNCTGAAC